MIAVYKTPREAGFPVWVRLLLDPLHPDAHVYELAQVETGQVEQWMYRQVTGTRYAELRA